jgi:hypothetical protein
MPQRGAGRIGMIGSRVINFTPASARKEKNRA